MPRAQLIQFRRDTAANWTSVNPTLANGEGGFETDTLKFKIGDGSTAWNSLAYVSSGGGSLSDGDKGDITVSGSGATWSIDNDVVTYAKIQNVSTDRLLGRDTAGAGDVEEIPLTAAGRALIDDADAAAQRTTLGLGTAALLASDTDTALAANSDSRAATQKAVKAYVDALLAASDAVVYKGVTDCSANPNYPAADAGHLYVVSVAGKIGGASGLVVEAGDLFICKTDGTSSGTQAGVGANWNVIQTNITYAAVNVDFSTYSDKTTPVDADTAVINDSAASGAIKKLTWANIKATLKTYFDGIYQSILVSGTSIKTVNSTSLLGSGDISTTQTTVSGNAGTATALQTARSIDGQSFNGSADITVIAPGTHAATGKTTPVDADELPLVDSAASNVLKKLTWANLKATLKTYLDTLYGALGNMPVFARVTGSNFTTTSTSAVDITGLSVPLLANSVYKFSSGITGNGADANGMQFAVNFSAAGASVESGIIADTLGTGARTRRINALNTLTPQKFFTSNTDVFALITGVMRTGANPGNITIQTAKNTSGTATVYIDSCLEVIKIA